jgi:serine phosphatase RsbU (regulator of sigma subunit)
MRRLLVILLSFSLFNSSAQSFADQDHYLIDSLELDALDGFEYYLVDSCVNAFHKATHDTDKVDAIVHIIEESWDYNVWPKYNEWLEGYLSNKLSASNLDPLVVWKLKEAKAIVFNTKGYFYDDKGDIPKAIEFYHESLKIREEIKDLEGMALSYNNIGGIYHFMEDFPLALDYYQKSLDIEIELQDTVGMARSYSNMGIIYHLQGDSEKGIDLMLQGLALKEAIDDKEGLASGYINLGITYKQMGDMSMTIDYYEKGLKLYEEIQSDRGMASTLINLGNLYLDKGDYIKAREYLTQSLEISDKLELLVEVKDASELLSGIHEQTGDFKQSLKMYKLFVLMRDSIMNEEALKATIELQAKYEYEKKAATDSIQNAEQEKVHAANLEAEKAVGDKLRAESNARKKQNIFLFIGLGLVGLFGFFMYNRFLVTRKQKDVIEEQRKEVQSAHEQLAAHHEEIQDSIVYAKRIQEAIMPSMEAMKDALKNGFVLYLPKHVVAGDFFWMEPIGDWVYFAAADCTGHGVPGAMVSVVCSNALTKSILEEKITHLGNLLDRTREIVVERLAKSGEEVKDGMDISICALNIKTKKLRWAGANNPLWIVREGMTEIEEYRPDKQPVGKYAIQEAFTEHEIQLQQGDSIYVFSDGYQDQFGGPKGKKFKTSQLKKLILDIQHHPMDGQKKQLLDTLNKWQGRHEQIDDICMIGVKV